jgi:secreted trypsin-like serine protease
MAGSDVAVPADADVRLYGWGTTGIQDDTTKALDVKGHIARTADYLQVGAEKAIPVAACKAVDQDLTAGMICTRSADPAAHTASCYGDSGGPLVIGDVTGDVDGEVLVGVVKGSMVGCGLPGIPDEFTAVSPYRQWIARAMGALKPATAPGVPADARILRVPFAAPGSATAR